MCFWFLDLAPALLSSGRRRRAAKTANKSFKQQPNKNMKKEFVKFACVGVAVAAFGASAYAIPTQSLTLQVTGGPGATGTIQSPNLDTYAGSLGNWDINVTTGVGTGSQITPDVDLDSIDYYGVPHDTAGNVLTITYTLSDVGPFLGSYQNLVSGNGNGMAVTYNILVNGISVNSQPLTVAQVNTGFNSLADLYAGTGTSIAVQAVLTAVLRSDDNVSFNDALSPVPDGGMTVAMLGLALGTCGMFARKMKKLA